ncbi:MAG TPA: DNA recombination protein RmuC [Bacteroidales bacterium]|nr:DNA recombination protein RmuC [Bacteroidales bacterium]HOH22166.1 DNA recombination protein RmuC [Bacteroidales bacterium]HPB57712.1 DNA recombination protein RmuC [Bacteroidales bacterium]HPZ02591.1 DNA recombination protein RmuC [Bacteroidales bacterium]HQB74510.1 DNA recombination protein RmuC [Bacteroidales bacterium]
MTLIILAIVIILLIIVNIIITFSKKGKDEVNPQIKNLEDSMIKFDATLEKIDKLVKDEFQRNRTETHDISQKNREELSKSLKLFGDQFTENTKELKELLRLNFGEFSKRQVEISEQTTKQTKEIKQSVETELKNIREDNTKQLNEMRVTVDEKLQKTLNERLSKSFETVGKQLQAVQEGLGEMKNLATDVGSLKRVLSNVKMRGGIGEIQLEMLLEQILAPDQYEANVKTKANSDNVVEFAIKLPGRDETAPNVWLPIDAKFPKDRYEQLQDAYDDGDPAHIQAAQKNLEDTIKSMAKDISDKYLDPPNTTDFGIMFLPFEGIYAEVVRKAALLEDLQRNYKVIVTGPTTLAAILNSLQMGFKTLAIQKRSSEVWQVLGAVKKEFDNFGGLIEKAQKNIQTGLNQLDTLAGTRTRAIQRKLRNVESLSESEAQAILSLPDSVLLDDDEEEYEEENEL